ncbi:hypothetical protein [Cellulosimicrobium cellulans]|uniref:hypothetical protein n=1 Tax=Cellulosimicrobium cellulans TaxID=1710 RepID=UPI0016520A8A|nr:hypothetical protein [Cellulosimicrobium cellulans]
MSPRFVLVGLGAELSLRPLGRRLADLGHRTVVVDLADRAADASVVPPGDGPLVLVSSQHLAMSGGVYDEFTGLTSHYVAPQVLRDRLGADLLVYVPHDLSEPVLDSEVDLLQTVDLYAAADRDAWWASAHVPTVVVGWAGTAGPDSTDWSSAPVDQGVLFLTQVRWLMEQGGPDFVRRTLARTLASGLAVKLPVWPGIESLADALREDGVPLLDPLLPAALVARHTPLVVTNGPSSVLAEASDAGHRPLVVLPPEGDRTFAGQLDSVDVVVCRDEDFPVAAAQAGRVRPAAAPFDVEAFLSAVSDALARGRA